ncbi:MAG: ABC transporter ATP-binding protein [Candidatus Hydrogenedentota bacterium]
MLEIRNLSKRFGPLTAVDDFTLTIPGGEIMGFVGPNGAGKTTTMRMIAGLIEPDEGSIHVDGINAVEDAPAVRRVLGYMPDFFGLYDDLKVWEYLDFFAAAYRIPRKDRGLLVDQVLELTDLTVKKDAFVESLSRGMKQRLCLAKTLVHDPKLLLLDEPASGLDPRARIELRTLLKELQSMGKTILISSHILSELSDICSHVVIIEKGRLLLAGPIKETLKNMTLQTRWMIELLDGSEAGVEVLKRFASLEVREAAHGKIVFDNLAVPDNSHEVLKALVDAGVGVRQYKQVEAGVEGLFLQVTKGEVA